MSIPKIASKLIGDKRRYREYKARTERLPGQYRTAIEALERYLFIFGPGTGDGVQAMLDDLAELFEQSAASATPVREIVGDDPSDFVDQFLRNYPEGGWITKERDRLSKAIDLAAADGVHESGSR